MSIQSPPEMAKAFHILPVTFNLYHRPPILSPLYGKNKCKS